MSSVSNNAVVELFKNVYGEMHDLVPDDQLLSKEIPWQDGDKVGTKFVEDVILGAEVGITFGGSSQEAFEIEPAIAGAVKQTEVTPYVTILPSILPFATISRSLGSEQAFLAATKFITKNNLKSHNELKEVTRLYGQSSAGLGYVSYYSGVYRGQAFTNGTGTLNGITFTNGVNTSSKAILFQQGSFAAGHWVGKQGIKIKQVATASGAVVAAGKLVSVNAAFGYIVVDFTPVAASSATSHKLVYSGWQDQGEMYGMDYILTQSGSLFGINNSIYSLFKGNSVNNGGQKLTLTKVQGYIADAVNGGGLEGDVTLLVNPRSWATMAVTESGLRVYDQSYKPASAQNGFMDLEFYSQNGKLTVKAHRCVKEGDAFILKMDTWKRSGSAQVGFRVPGIEGDLIKPLENQAGYVFRSFSDEYLFCFQPAYNIKISNINDEASN